jgi:hypothetical protein
MLPSARLLIVVFLLAVVLSPLGFGMVAAFLVAREPLSRPAEHFQIAMRAGPAQWASDAAPSGPFGVRLTDEEPAIAPGSAGHPGQGLLYEHDDPAGEPDPPAVAPAPHAVAEDDAQRQEVATASAPPPAAGPDQSEQRREEAMVPTPPAVADEHETQSQQVATASGAPEAANDEAQRPDVAVAAVQPAAGAAKGDTTDNAAQVVAAVTPNVSEAAPSAEGAGIAVSVPDETAATPVPDARPVPDVTASINPLAPTNDADGKGAMVSASEFHVIDDTPEDTGIPQMVFFKGPIPLPKSRPGPEARSSKPSPLAAVARARARAKAAKAAKARARATQRPPTPAEPPPNPFAVLLGTGP